MRSFLKSRSGRKARHLRHELGKLADATNAARDWDTLMQRAESALEGERLRLLEDDLHKGAAAAHRPALDMLDSDRWPDVMRQWEAYIHRHPPSDRATNSKGKELRRAGDRVVHAWQRANLAGSSRNWHKLRIAVKDLRYRLEADPGTAKSVERAKLLERCKQLQDLLGDWHDTVVHLQLLREIMERYDPHTDADRIRRLQAWCRELDAEGRHCLETVGQEFASAEMTRLSASTEAAL